eukprot:TRINITY_DN56011_c0_g1_i1.p1 TRINITY_DN56011_c0_g1~~TRINITY_DN56011_c0_g1_i1.p1  ORF type:complete len:633 (+),score=73.72 TRINITY_DN56011_c0_g1_i1:148-2046(+)
MANGIELAVSLGFGYAAASAVHPPPASQRTLTPTGRPLSASPLWPPARLSTPVRNDRMSRTAAAGSPQSPSANASPYGSAVANPGVHLRPMLGIATACVASPRQHLYTPEASGICPKRLPTSTGASPVRRLASTITTPPTVPATASPQRTPAGSANTAPPQVTAAAPSMNATLSGGTASTAASAAEAAKPRVQCWRRPSTSSGPAEAEAPARGLQHTNGSGSVGSGSPGSATLAPQPARTVAASHRLSPPFSGRHTILAASAAQQPQAQPAAVHSRDPGLVGPPPESICYGPMRNGAGCSLQGRQQQATVPGVGSTREDPVTAAPRPEMLASKQECGAQEVSGPERPSADGAPGGVQGVDPQQRQAQVTPVRRRGDTPKCAEDSRTSSASARISLRCSLGGATAVSVVSSRTGSKDVRGVLRVAAVERRPIYEHPYPHQPRSRVLAVVQTPCPSLQERVRSRPKVISKSGRSPPPSDVAPSVATADWAQLAGTPRDSESAAKPVEEPEDNDQAVKRPQASLGDERVAAGMYSKLMSRLNESASWLSDVSDKQSEDNATPSTGENTANGRTMQLEGGCLYLAEMLNESATWIDADISESESDSALQPPPRGEAPAQHQPAQADPHVVQRSYSY